MYICATDASSQRCCWPGVCRLGLRQSRGSVALSLLGLLSWQRAVGVIVRDVTLESRWRQQVWRCRRVVDVTAVILHAKTWREVKIVYGNQSYRVYLCHRAAWEINSTCNLEERNFMTRIRNNLSSGLFFFLQRWFIVFSQNNTITTNDSKHRNIEL